MVSRVYFKDHRELAVRARWSSHRTSHGCTSTFLTTHFHTGVNFMEKTISVRRTTITFSIWDLGGQREFVNMLPLVCNDAVAILFMFDLSRKSTLNSVKEWYRQARGFNKVRVSHFRAYWYIARLALFYLVQHACAEDEVTPHCSVQGGADAFVWRRDSWAFLDPFRSLPTSLHFN